MRVIVKPSICKGSITIPPSKSMAHRAIICASLTNGHSVISNVDYSQDILATIEGMRKLGAIIKQEEHTLHIDGISNFQQLNDTQIHCKESGSTLRFFLPIFSLCNQPITFTGEGRLMKRPQKVYKDIFEKQGLPFFQSEDEICISSSLKPDHFILKGDISSQFISGLLFTLPLLSKDSTIQILPPFESRSYVELTLQMLETFGIHAYFKEENLIYIPGNQTYKPCQYTVEGDFSQFAFFAVLAALQHDLFIKGVNPSSKQGDKQILTVLKDFGINFEEKEEGYLIHKGIPQGAYIDLANCPDLGPILCVLGMYAQKETHIAHAKRLRMKESDRISAMEEELRKFKVDITSSEDDIFIKGKQTYSCEHELYGHNDHRIVMALCIAALCANKEVVIDGAQAINKSYPSFFDDIISIQGKVECL